MGIFVFKSTRQLCRAYGVSWRTVQNWIKQGAPIAVLDDGTTRTIASDLQEWLVQQSKKKFRKTLEKAL